jgi:hypothetical protein
VLRRAAAIGWAAWLLGASAAAQTPVASEDARIAEALSLRVQQRDAEALSLLTSVWNDTRSPRARAQMARAEQALGRWLDAHAHVEEALAAASDPWIAARRASLEEERERMRAHLGRVEVLCDVPGATARIDGRDVGALPLAAAPWASAGTVQVEVLAPGHLAAQRSVVVRAGETARETVTLVPLPAPVAPPAVVVARPAAAVDAPGRGTLWTTLGATAVAAGSVLLVGGAVSHGVRELSVASAAAAGCGEDPSGALVGPPECGGRVATIDLAAALAVTGYAAGAALLGSGVALLVTAPRATPAPARAGVRCAPSWGGATCALAF